MSHTEIAQALPPGKARPERTGQQRQPVPLCQSFSLLGQVRAARRAVAGSQRVPRGTWQQPNIGAGVESNVPAGLMLSHGAAAERIMRGVFQSAGRNNARARLRTGESRPGGKQ